MSSTSSQELAASASDLNEPECEPSRSVRSTQLAAESSQSIGLMSPALTMSERLPQNASEYSSGSDALTLFAEGSLAKTSAPPDLGRGLAATAAASGPSTPELLARFDPDSSSWRTSQRCLIEGWTLFSETWPRSGTMRSGIAYQLPPLARPTDAIGFGLWPTPHGFSQDGKSNGPSGNELGRAVNRSMVPTPKLPSGGGQTVRTTAGGGIRKLEDWVSAEIGQNTGSLNPTWVEWLMGFPAEWTALKDSATPSSRKSRKSSDVQS